MRTGIGQDTVNLAHTKLLISTTSAMNPLDKTDVVHNTSSLQTLLEAKKVQANELLSSGRELCKAFHKEYPNSFCFRSPD